MTLSDLRKLAPDMVLTVPVGQLLELIAEAALEKGGVVRWVKLSDASDMTGIPSSTLRYRAVRWHNMQLQGRIPPVRVARTAGDTGHWLFDESDLSAMAPAKQEDDETTTMIEEMTAQLLEESEEGSRQRRRLRRRR